MDYQKALRYIHYCMAENLVDSGMIEEYFDEFYPFKVKNIEGAIAVTGNDIYVIIRGSDSWKDFLYTNIRMFFGSTAFMYKDTQVSLGKIHKGFGDAWMSVRDIVLIAIRSLIDKHEGARIHFIGHSLGSALARLGALDTRYYLKILAEIDYTDKIECYCFGPVVLGDEKYHISWSDLRKPFGFVNGGDIVCLRLSRLGYVEDYQKIEIGNKPPWWNILGRVTNHFMSSYAIELEKMI